MSSPDDSLLSMPLVVTGMHRSGTSLLASAMQAAGVAMGETLLEASASNVKGHFEDVEFLAWHEAVFSDHDRTVYDAHEGGPLAISDARRAEAAALVAARRGLWGFKDPRTCLFLDFWADLLPQAKFLFIVRRPEEVVASLRQRGHAELQRHFRGSWALKQLGLDLTFRRRRAIEWWLASNRAILDFAQRRPERSLVVDLAALPRRLPKAIAFMRETWGLPLREVDLASIFEPRLLHAAPAAGDGSRHSRTAQGRVFAALCERAAAIGDEAA